MNVEGKEAKVNTANAKVDISEKIKSAEFVKPTVDQRLEKVHKLFMDFLSQDGYYLISSAKGAEIFVAREVVDFIPTGLWNLCGYRHSSAVKFTKEYLDANPDKFTWVAGK